MILKKMEEKLRHDSSSRLFFSVLIKKHLFNFFFRELSDFILFSDENKYDDKISMWTYSFYIIIKK